MFIVIIVGLCFLFGFNEYAFSYQGHSAPYREFLNQPKPDWLNIGEPIKVEVVEDKTKIHFNEPDDNQVIKLTRHTISLPEKDIILNFGDDSIEGWYSWDNPRKRLLSPDGQRLIVQAGEKTYLYKIVGQGVYEEIKFEYPILNFDSEKRGMISGWRWVSNDVIIGEVNIENPETGEEEGNYLYLYYLEKRILSRLNIESLNFGKLENLEVVDISEEYFKLRINGKEQFVKVDFKTLPKIIEVGKSATEKGVELIEAVKKDENIGKEGRNEISDRERSEESVLPSKQTEKKVALMTEGKEVECQPSILKEHWGYWVVGLGIVLTFITGILFYKKRR